MRGGEQLSTRITAGATLRAAGGGESAVVLRLRKGACGGGGRQQQEVRGVWPEGAKPRAAGGGEETVVRWLCESNRGGGRRQTQGSRQEGCPEEEMIGFLPCENVICRTLSIKVSFWSDRLLADHAGKLGCLN